MKKNIASVIDAFHAEEAHQEKTCRTDGRVIYSYAMPIAVRYGSVVYVLDPSEAPSVTTASQIRAILAALPAARKTTEAHLGVYFREEDTAPEEAQEPLRDGAREDFHADG